MPRLRVMTLNVWGYRGDWPARRRRLVSLLQREEIDILLLQEIAECPWRPNQAIELAYLTGYQLAIATAQRFFPWPTFSTGLSLLSRFPLSNLLATELVAPGGLIPVGPHQRRICMRVEAALDGMSVVIYNTHFPLDAQARLQAAQRLWRQVAQEEAVLVVVGGDFNAPPDEQSVLFLQGRMPLHSVRGQLVDSWATAGMGPEETFPSHEPLRRIDYIFYQAEPSVIVQESRVIGLPPETLSDHAGVLTTFAISPTRDLELPIGEEPVGSLEPTGTGGGLFGL